MKLSKLRDDTYRVARAEGDIEAAEKGPSSYARRRRSVAKASSSLRALLRCPIRLGCYVMSTHAPTHCRVVTMCWQSGDRSVDRYTGVPLGENPADATRASFPVDKAVIPARVESVEASLNFGSFSLGCRDDFHTVEFGHAAINSLLVVA